MFRSSTPSRRDSVRRTPHAEVLPCDVPTRHLHFLPPHACLEQSTAEWLAKVERRLPLSMINTNLRSIPSVRATTGVTFRPTGSLLLRIAKTKMSGEERNYQLFVRLGQDAVLSCPTGKSGGLQDYFLLSLKNFSKLDGVTLDIFVCPINNSLEQRVNAKITSLKAKASGFFQKVHRANSATATTTALALVEVEDPVLSLPLAALLQDGDVPQLEGCFPVRSNENYNSSVVGEIALHLVASPDALVYPTTIGAPQQPSQGFQHYLTVQLGPHRWHRSYVVLEGRELNYRSFQRHHLREGSPINLDTVVAIDFKPTHPCGLDNVITLRFENGTQVVAHADCEQKGFDWADAIHRAVWNQPYLLEA